MKSTKPWNIKPFHFQWKVIGLISRYMGYEFCCRYDSFFDFYRDETYVEKSMNIILQVSVNKQTRAPRRGFFMPWCYGYRPRLQAQTGRMWPKRFVPKSTMPNHAEPIYFSAEIAETTLVLGFQARIPHPCAFWPLAKHRTAPRACQAARAGVACERICTFLRQKRGFHKWGFHKWGYPKMVGL